MYRKYVKVNVSEGLFHRHATCFVQTAHKFQCQITIMRDGRSANAKSLLDLLSMALFPGTEVVLIADGIDEIEAVETLSKLVTGKL